jgi:peptidyl-Lys metalloendopeptidase
MKNKFIAKGILAVGTCIMTTSIFGAANPIEVNLVDMGNNVLNVSFKNTSDTSISFLKYNTPFFNNTKLFGDFFKFKGSNYKYVGFSNIKVKITDSGFITLKPGETISTQIALDASYRIFNNSLGTLQYWNALTYKVNPNKSFKSSSDLTTEIIQSKEAPVELFHNNENVPYDKSNLIRDALQFGNNSVVDSSCSGGFSEDVSQAYKYAVTLVNTSIDDLNSLDVTNVPIGQLTAPRYNRWFGVYFSEAFNFVKTTYNNMKKLFPKATIYCDCPTSSDYDNAYAYSDMARPYTIVVCKQFWNAPVTGTDSKSGTLVHEMSHFYDVGGTIDVVYGQAAARNLAASTPISATHNADNYEYFSENNPYIPIK